MCYVFVYSSLIARVNAAEVAAKVLAILGESCLFNLLQFSQLAS